MSENLAYVSFQRITDLSLTETTDKIIDFIQNKPCKFDENTIRTAVLLTGINQFEQNNEIINITRRLEEKLACFTVTLQSEFIHSTKDGLDYIVQEVISCGEDDEDEMLLKKHQLNLAYLLGWYMKNYNHEADVPEIVILFADFEGFSSDILQDLILTLHSYSEQLPFVFIFGIATSVYTIHSMIPYHVTNKISVRTFQREPVATLLNKIIANVIFTKENRFYLSEKTFQLLNNTFDLCDFSIARFFKGFKYCMLEHYSQGNSYGFASLLDTLDVVNSLNSTDLDMIRSQISFRKYVEKQNPEVIIKILTKDKYLRKKLPELINNVKAFCFNFTCAINVLHQLIHDLPKSPLGRQLRELYPICVSSTITNELQELYQLLKFMAKNDLTLKVEQLKSVLLPYLGFEFSEEAELFYSQLNTAKNELETTKSEVKVKQEKLQEEPLVLLPRMQRSELNKKLLAAAKQSETTVSRDKYVLSVINSLKEFFNKTLQPLSKAPPLHELFVFSNPEKVQLQFMGMIRQEMHSALSNPASVNKCECCVIENESVIKPTMPDMCIAYKLYLEQCGKMIKLKDWLRAFNSIVSDQMDADDEDDGDDNIQPEIE